MSLRFRNFLETAAGAVAGGGGGAATTSAHGIAGYRSSLFGGNKKKKKKKNTTIRRVMGGPMGNTYSFKFFAEAEQSEFDPADVISKLKTAAKAAEDHNADTTAFALEDEEGAMVKVWVPDDQADDFQTSLEAALSRSDDDEDDQNDQLEIAEVLWKLRKDFDIVDVEWGEIEEDQEETVTPPAEGGGVATGEEGATGVEGEAPAEGEGMEGEGEGEGEMTAGAEGGESEATALQQVIDMMKADARARKAEAEAEQAKAEAEAAKYAAQAAEQKVKQEEEILDMEAYYDAEKKEKQEAERLAKLAKYRHDLAGDKGATLGKSESGPARTEEPPESPFTKGPEVPEEMPGAMPEMEEESKPRKRFTVSRGELSDMLLRVLRGDE